MSRFRQSLRTTLEVLAESFVPEWIQDRYHREGFFGSFDVTQERSKYEAALELLSKLLPAEEWGDALEIGCAEGSFTALLAPRCKRLRAVDISEVACSRAAARCAGFANVELRQADFIRDPIEGQYDLVFAMDVWEYVRGKRRLLNVGTKVANLLKPDGLLIFCDVTAHPGRNSWLARRIVTAPDERLRILSQIHGLRLMARQYHPCASEPVIPYVKHVIAAFLKSA